jgi:hypothetical protein
MENERTPDELWKDFWKDTVCNDDGSVNIDQLKLELADFSMLLHNAAIVYCEATHGIISKVETCADIVVDVMNEQNDEFYFSIYQDDVKEILEFGFTPEEKIEEIKKYFKIG